MNEFEQIALELHVFKGKIIERREGRGGLIYIVEQDAYPRRIAYKTIKEFETNNRPFDTTRIIREARNWFTLSGHPLVFTPHLIKIWDDVPLIRMPYCDGDLRRFIDERQSLTAVICLSLQIVQGMIVANRRGMEHHQDIKPENLFYIDLSAQFEDFPPSNVDPVLRYSVRIGDFGVANAWRDNHKGGTNAYKAPEQYDGHPEESIPTFAPDIFAVGVVIAELFRGFHPASATPGTNVWNWRGSKLKKWATGGKRNIFAPDDTPEAAALSELINAMLSPDPTKRPAFTDCYRQLVNLLKTLSPTSLEQLELLFRYYDYVSTHFALEQEIDRQVRLANAPGELQSVKDRITERLRGSLEVSGLTLDGILSVYHLADALHRLCEAVCAPEDKQLLIKATKLVICFVLQQHQMITADCLWPSFSFDGPKGNKSASDIEAKTEILCSSIKRLQVFDAYDKDLQCEIEAGDDTIQACLLMNNAIEAWSEQRIDDACNLLSLVREKTSNDPALDKLYQDWVSMKKSRYWCQVSDLDGSETPP